MEKDVTGSQLRSPGWRLILLPVVAILPILAFVFFLVAHLSKEKEQRLEGAIVDVAGEAIALSDQILVRSFATLNMLAQIAPSDREFRQQAERLVREDQWLAIQLRGRDGLPAETISRSGAPDLSAAILPDDLTGSAAPAAAAVVVGDNGDRAYLMIAQTLEMPGGAVFAALNLEPFSAALRGLDLPEGWIVALLGPGHRIAGRSRAHEQFVGRRATPSLVEMIGSQQGSFFYSFNQEGEPVYTAVSRSSVTGWSAAVGVPAAVARGIISRSGWWLTAGGGFAVLVAGFLAWLVITNIRNERESERRGLEAEGARRAEARLQDIAAKFPGVLYRRVLHPDGTVTFPFISSSGDTPFTARLNGLMGSGMSIERVSQIYATPEARMRFVQEIDRTATTLDVFEFEGPILGDDGKISWVRSLARPHRDADGSVVWDGALLDVTELKATTEALERRTSALETVHGINLRLAAELDVQTLTQSVTDATTRLIGADFGAFFRNPRESEDSYELFTLSGADRNAFAGFPMPRHTEVFGPTLRGEGTILSGDIMIDPRYGKNDPYFGMPPGHLPVRSYLAVPVKSRSGEVLGGLFFGHPEPDVFDASASQAVEGIAAQTAIAMDNARMFQQTQAELENRRRTEQHQRLLLAELNHRVKNTLAVVVSIADQTARVSRDREEFITAFRRRLIAISDGHTLLSEAEWKGAPLRSLLTKALQAHSSRDRDEWQLQGPDVTISPRQAIALSLVFHELAAGAKLRGALRSDSGFVSVKWGPSTEQPEKLELRWSEGGFSFADAVDDRFGKTLIDLNVRVECGGAIVRLQTPDAMSFAITLPWDPLESLVDTGTSKHAANTFYQQ